MRATVLGILTTLLVAASADAQKRCKKGIPCGNTCIAASKTCHVGTPSTTPARPLVGQTARPDARPLPRQPTTPDTTQGMWVASSQGTKYYRATCSAAKRLSPANRVYFKTEEDARRAGYDRSTSSGC